ncbi:recombinase family protein [Desertibacillus haloalkaliphilus]|uniref:recombinase family protein n=1 Tax=Desertibacillus haloalkaliphilus TaxID=1328930 RepID=UPI001C25F382|nr:recombinase family protein [Desertibacillus haloalkaliphilus]MBU8905587.1 recombinase family protein [Desertibacillus haloalkaliphilus]
MIIGYARVSTKEQSLDMQLDALHKSGCERIFKEKVSGSKDDREQLHRVLETLRTGDKFVVYKLDRLARSTLKLLKVAEQLEQQGVELISIQDNIDTTTPMGKAMFRMLSVLAELERDMIRERTRSGLEAARARGRKGGRPKKNEKKVEQALKMYKTKQFTIAEITDATGVSSSTLYRSISSL